jgi:hypothetical protein
LPKSVRHRRRRQRFGRAPAAGSIRWAFYYKKEKSPNLLIFLDRNGQFRAVNGQFVVVDGQKTLAILAEK